MSGQRTTRLVTFAELGGMLQLPEGMQVTAVEHPMVGASLLAVSATLVLTLDRVESLLGVDGRLLDVNPVGDEMALIVVYREPAPAAAS